jgi:hypothetical protein
MVRECPRSRSTGASYAHDGHPNLLHDPAGSFVGIALGGWLSGAIFDLTGSYRLALGIGIWLLGQPRRSLAVA